MFKSKSSRYGAPRSDSRSDYREHSDYRLRTDFDQRRSDERRVFESVDEKRPRPASRTPYDYRGHESRDYSDYDDDQEIPIRGHENEQRRHPITRRSLKREGAPFWKEIDDADSEDERPSVIRFMLAIALLVCISIFLWLLYRWMSPSYKAEPPFIPADSSPYKVKPDHPGGMDIPHQDMLVYGRLSPKRDPEPEEKLLPPLDQPVLSQEPLPEHLPSVESKNPMPAPAHESDPKPISPEPKVEPLKKEPAQKKFSVVLASFPSQSLANKELERLKQLGYQNLIVKQNQKLFCVTFKTLFDSQEQATNMCVGRRGCRVMSY